MEKATGRVYLKAYGIAFTVFTILAILGVWYFLSHFKIDTDTYVTVVTATEGLVPGTIVSDSQVLTKRVKASSVSMYVVNDIKSVVGKKLIAKVAKDDFFRGYELLGSEQWKKDDEREMTICFDYDARVGNTVKKGSYVDVRLLSKEKSAPKVVISKILIDEIFDEAGLVVVDTDKLGSRKAFLRFVLNKEQRDRLYIASESGKLRLDLYYDSSQPKLAEDVLTTP